MNEIAVTFDSNVWENVVDKGKRSVQKVYSDIYNLIKHGTIEPFFFEGLVIIEGIPKRNRRDYFLNFKPTFRFQEGSEKHSISIGTEAPELTNYLKSHLPIALKLGFKFIRCPRIGLPSLDIPKMYLAPDRKYSLKERLRRTFECATFIENHVAGKKKWLTDEENIGIIDQIKKATGLGEKQFAKLIAEWADSDSIAAHYGYGIDYFCTNDMAKGAGAASVLYSENQKKLNDRFGVRVIQPHRLIEIGKRVT